MLAADKVRIVVYFNIQVDIEKDAFRSAFIDIMKSIGIRQHVSGPTNYHNHTLDSVMSDGIYINGVGILQQSDNILHLGMKRLTGFTINRALNFLTCAK